MYSSLIITTNSAPVHAYNFNELSIETSTIPIENGAAKPKIKAAKHKKNKFRTKPNNQKKRLIYTILIIIGVVLALLAILLIIYLAPTVVAMTVGTFPSILTYLGWFAFAICTLGSMMLLFIGIILLNNTPKGDVPLTPTEQLIEDNSKKFPNFPEQKIEEYVALEEEVVALKKEKEELEGKSSERLNEIEKELEIKQKKQLFLEELNAELGSIPSENRIEYIFLKEEIHTLTTKKDALKGSSDESSRTKVEKIELRIDEDLKKLNSLK